MSDKKILVPHDFTEVADCAVNHAAKLAETIGASIYLLHVVAKAGEIEDSNKKLKAKAEEIMSENSGIKVEYLSRIGNIFDDIGDAASEISASLIVMGTHGVKGFKQAALGSYALKVITHSDVPFIVVQGKKIKENGYDDIVVPLDLHKETKQKLDIVAEMAKYFESRVHLITPKETDEFLHNQLERNLIFAKKYLKERGIEFTTTVGQGGAFDKEIVMHADSIGADLIAIMNLQKSSLLGMLGSSYEQNMITNSAQIPVVCINPVSTTVAGGNAGIFY